MKPEAKTQNSIIDKQGSLGYYKDSRISSESLSEQTSIDRLLTAQEVSELLSVKKSYVYWLTHSKKIPHIKIEGLLRFRRSHIEDWLAKMEVRNNVST